jgi:long-chain acyl-CoA synthetase
MSSNSVVAERAEIDAAIHGRTLCDLVARNAQTYADQPALSWKEDASWRTLSWADFRQRVAEAAMGLGALGLSRGDFVAIMARSRPEHLIADITGTSARHWLPTSPTPSLPRRSTCARCAPGGCT